MADQFLFVVQPEISGRGAAGDDQRLGLEPFIIGLEPDMLVARLEIGHFGVGKTGAEFLGLSVHVQDQLRSVDAVRKSWDNFRPAWSWKAAHQAADLPEPAD